MRQVISERRVGGLVMQRALYSWAAGDSLGEVDPQITLKLVSGHHPVRARCFRDDGESHSIGRLILTPPGEELSAIATNDESDMRATVFHIDGELLERSLRSCGSAITIADFALDLDMHDSQIEAALLRLSAELEREAFGGPLVVDALTRLLIVDLARHAAAEHEACAEFGSGLRPAQLAHIRAFVNSFDIGLPTPAEVAAECKLSPTHLRRLFKRATGESLQDYIKEVRINRAKTMLSDAEMPLKVVSYRLGFNHCSAFSFAFQQVTGETPGQFRRRNAANLNDALAVDASAFAVAGPGRC